MAAHAFSPSIFREYDIRGVVGESLHAPDAYAIGQHFAAKIAYKPGVSIVVGRDGRLTSPTLAEALKRGIADSGIPVIDIGVGPTPMLYFAAHTLGASAGVMVTGSHNPPDHNGFKFVLGGRAFYGADIASLMTPARSPAHVRGTAEIKSCDVQSAYLDVLLQAYTPTARSLHIAWDAGNGAAGEVMKALCQRLPGRHIALNAAIDGTFPAHHPDPSEPKNLRQLAAAVREHRLDAGIAFDGDGDRIGVVDDQGEILWGDQLLMLYAADVLRDRPGATIIADVKASQSLFDEIARLGGTPLMWKTGHSLIKSKMAETGAPLAGEMSGHMFFADRYFGYDDALYAAVRFLSLLARTAQPLSVWRQSLPRVINTPELRFPCPDERKFEVIAEVAARLRQDGARFSDVDGVRVNSADGWWLLRASNTQAVLVARAEGADQAGLDRIVSALRRQLAASGIDLPI